MSTSVIDTRTIITLKGSVKIVSEFFFTAVNSILYQRGIYQPETFRREEKYGLTVLTTTESGLLTYLNQVMGQMEQWLLAGDVQKLVLVVAGIDSGETLERWQFNVKVDEDAKRKTVMAGNDENNPHHINSVQPVVCETLSKTSQKSLKEIHGEIQAIIRQITASVSHLGRTEIRCITVYPMCHPLMHDVALLHNVLFHRLHSFHSCRSHAPLICWCTPTKMRRFPKSGTIPILVTL